MTSSDIGTKIYANVVNERNFQDNKTQQKKEGSSYTREGNQEKKDLMSMIKGQVIQEGTSLLGILTSTTNVLLVITLVTR